MYFTMYIIFFKFMSLYASRWTQMFVTAEILILLPDTVLFQQLDVGEQKLTLFTSNNNLFDDVILCGI